MTQEGLARRFTTLLVVLALHCFFVLLLVMRQPVSRMTTPDVRPGVLFFVEAPRPPPTPLPAIQTRPTRSARVVIEATRMQEQPRVVSSPADPPATIDWNAHAAEAAATVVDRAIRQETRKCDPSDSPNSFLPRCKPRSPEFEWNPEPPRVGFSGGLPYVRVGERCAIGLGFFACGFGAKPPANGELFEHMSDPERDRSSVPSTDPSPGQRN